MKYVFHFDFFLGVNDLYFGPDMSKGPSFYCMLIYRINTVPIALFILSGLQRLTRVSFTSGLHMLCLFPCPRTPWDPAYACTHASWKYCLHSPSRTRFWSLEIRLKNSFLPYFYLDSWFRRVPCLCLLVWYWRKARSSDASLQLFCLPSLLICFLSSFSPIFTPTIYHSCFIGLHQQQLIQKAWALSFISKGIVKIKRNNGEKIPSGEQPKLGRINFKSASIPLERT